MSQVEINKVLESQVAAFATSKSISKVVYPNVGGSALPDVTHLRCEILPSPTVSPTVGSDHRRYGGGLRLQYMLLGQGTGSKPLYTVGDAIASWFKRGSKFTNGVATVVIDYPPDVSELKYETNFTYVTVDITYRCEVVENLP